MNHIHELINKYTIFKLWIYVNIIALVISFFAFVVIAWNNQLTLIKSILNVMIVILFYPIYILLYISKCEIIKSDFHLM